MGHPIWLAARCPLADASGTFRMFLTQPASVRALCGAGGEEGGCKSTKHRTQVGGRTLHSLTFFSLRFRTFSVAPLGLG